MADGFIVRLSLESSGVQMKRRLLYLLIAISSAVPHAAASGSSDAVEISTPSVIRFSAQIDPSIVAGQTTMKVDFSLYSNATEADAVWSESQNVAVDTSGKFTVLLGSTDPEGIPKAIFVKGNTLWLSWRTEGQTSNAKVRLVSVPYAMSSFTADTLQGHAPSDFASASEVENLKAMVSSLMSRLVTLEGRSSEGTSRISRLSNTPDPIVVGSQQTFLNSSIQANSGQASDRMPHATDAPASLTTFRVRDYGAACDGSTDDAVAIQRAVAAASVNGGTVEFAGLCGVGAAGISVASNDVTLKGSAKGGGIKILAPGPVFSTFGATSITFTDCAKCGVDHLLVEGNGVNTNPIGLQGTSQSGVSNTTIHAAGNLGAVVAVNNRTNKYVNNQITDGVGVARGLWIGNAMASQLEASALIANNNVSGMKATGIVCTCTDSAINNNQSTHNGGSGIIFPAAGPYRASKVTASGNTVSFNKFSGFQSDAATQADYSEFITLTNNVSEGNQSSGVYVVRARDWVVQENQVRNNMVHGVEIGEAKRINITRNLAEDTRIGADRTQNVGIHISAQATGTNDVEEVTVTGNVTKNNLSNGIFAVNCSPNTMTGVTLSSNTSSDNGAYGVRASAAAAGEISQVSITGNILSNNSSGPVRVDLINGLIEANQ